jgi:hypothetical protein
MFSDRSRLQSLVDALPDSEVQVAISFLAELGEQEILDAETAAKLGSGPYGTERRCPSGRSPAPARAVIRRVVFRPAAVRDLARLDRVVQARIDAALVRFAATGHGDVKSPQRPSR